MIIDIVDIIKIVIGGLCVGLASSVTVGPVAVLCIQRTLSRGYLSGIFSGLGVASADTLMAILSFTLYALLKEYIDKYNTAIMICGGIFVIIVGIFIFFKNPVPQVRKNRTGKNELWQDFASMFGFTLANFVVVIPYLLAFFAMFNVGLQSSADDVASLVRSAMTIVGFLAGAMAWWVSLTLIIDLFRRRFRPRHMLTINHIAGVVIAVLGVYTILSTFFNILPK